MSDDIIVLPSDPIVIVAEPDDTIAIVADNPTVLIAADGPSYMAGGLTVNVKTDFGAKGDGLTDDTIAIVNAGLFLKAYGGGGRMYFPAGTYLMPQFGNQIRIVDNVEYFGDGYASHIVGNNTAFATKGNLFGRNTLGGYTYYPAHNIAAGDSTLTTTTGTDAANFKVGDIVAAISTSFLAGPGADTLPYYVEINRVIAVDSTGGTLTLEDTIDDAWTGVQLANVTSDFSWGFSIHDLRISATLGTCLYLSGWYKSSLYDCWIEGPYGVLACNGMVRSTMHDIIGTVAGTNSALEIEIGSVRASIYDIEIHVTGSAGGNPPFYCQEFSRRTTIRNVNLYAPSTSIDVLFRCMPSGHVFKDIYVEAAYIGKVLDFIGNNPVFFLPDMTTRLEGITMDSRTGYGSGFVFYNPFLNGGVKNIVVKDCLLNGPPTTDIDLVWFLQGYMTNILFDNVSGPGAIECNMTGPFGFNVDYPDIGGPLTYPLTRVVFKDCEFTKIRTQYMLYYATWINSRRYGDVVPHPHYWPSTSAWFSTVPGTVVLQMNVPANSNPRWGDAIVVKCTVWWAAGSATNGHLALIIFGDVAINLSLPSAGPTGLSIDMEVQIDLINGTFDQPNKYHVAGIVMSAGVSQAFNPFFGNFDPGGGGAVQLQSWVDGAATFITPKMASITYVPVENRAQAGM